LRSTLFRSVVLAAAVALPAAAPAAEADFDDGAIQQIHYPEWFKQSFLDLADDAAMAADAGKQGLFVFFSTQGCSYCHLFIQKSLGDPAIAERLRAHFDAIGLEIFADDELTDFAGEGKPVKAFAVDEGVQFAPTIMFYDTAGTPLVKLTGYYEPERFRRVLDYLIDGHHQRMSLREYLAGAAADKSPTTAWSMPADPLFEPPPHALARDQMPAERPLLVLFEGTDCARCPRFHDEVLGDEDIRQKLAGFDIVRLDAADGQTPVLTPAGARTNPRDWYTELGFSALPALAFFADDGRQVLATDALVLASRMHNSIGFVTERAYDKGWNYQRYARSQALARVRSGDDPPGSSPD
jgi:thioredoxin-related protein